MGQCWRRTLGRTGGRRLELLPATGDKCDWKCATGCICDTRPAPTNIAPVPVQPFAYSSLAYLFCDIHLYLCRQVMLWGDESAMRTPPPTIDQAIQRTRRSSAWIVYTIAKLQLCCLIFYWRGRYSAQPGKKKNRVHAQCIAYLLAVCI